MTYRQTVLRNRATIWHRCLLSEERRRARGPHRHLRHSARGRRPVGGGATDGADVSQPALHGRGGRPRGARGATAHGRIHKLVPALLSGAGQQRHANPRPRFEVSYLGGEMRVSRDQDGKVFVYVRTSESTEPSDYTDKSADLGIPGLISSLTQMWSN